MCGVFGYIGYRKNASKIVFEGIKALEYRGYDSWGEAIIDQNNKLHLIKNVGKISGEAPKIESTLALGHTRWATHGGVTVANSHPQTDCKKRFALVHNGIIENFDELKKKLLKNHHFISQTDTEVAAHLLEEYLKKEDNFWQALIKTYLKLKGLNALVLVDKNTQKIYAVKNGSPLVVGFGKKEKQFDLDSKSAFRSSSNREEDP